MRGRQAGTPQGQPLVPRRPCAPRFAVLALAGLALCGALQPTTQAAAPDPGLEQALLVLTNADRTSQGLAALLPDDRLQAIARERSDDMVTRGYLSHEIPPDGGNVFPIIEARGVDFQRAAENIGETTAAREASARDVQARFLDSTRHRANVLSAAWSFIGIGAVPGGNRVVYTVLFVHPLPTDPLYARLLTAPPADLGPLSQDSGRAPSPFETIVDTILGRELGIPGLD